MKGSFDKIEIPFYLLNFKINTEMISLKISNAQENSLELVQRLRGFKSPGKKLLLDAIAINDWSKAYSELLYRVELYTQAKILNYSKKDLNNIVSGIHKFGVSSIVKQLVAKLPIKEQEVLKDVWTADAIDDAVETVYEELKTKFESELESGMLESWDILFDITNDGSYFESSNPDEVVIETIGNENINTMFNKTTSLVQEILLRVERKFDQFINMNGIELIK